MSISITEVTPHKLKLGQKIVDVWRTEKNKYFMPLTEVARISNQEIFRVKKFLKATAKEANVESFIYEGEYVRLEKDSYKYQGELNLVPLEAVIPYLITELYVDNPDATKVITETLWDWTVCCIESSVEGKDNE